MTVSGQSAPIQDGPSQSCEIPVYGPSPQDPTRSTLQTAQATWFPTTDGEVLVRIELPAGDIASAGHDLFYTLLGMRSDLHDHGWKLLVNASRRNVWGSTRQFPCHVDQVRVYPAFGCPAEPYSLHALALPDDLSEIGGASVDEQLLWRKEWAGKVAPGELSWTEYDRERRALRERET
ncbi:hypothetical protein ABZ805_26595 [Saccharopolyspora sp. NPDC047091]|uniref:hypothetical protein n=1 Tax=Saccharopolyspora sp. NPDC047091 TaxID=3155924 RepID=UPI0033F2F431